MNVTNKPKKNIITANLFGPFYSLTKKKSLKIDFGENILSPNILDIINRLIVLFPGIKQYIFNKNTEKLIGDSMIVLNGDIIVLNKWKNTPVTSNDRISFFQGVQGG